ncbi:MaoC family dehydratase [Georgenia sp. SYP-B2076]|uniref:MaoC family dehydratase n=1 Tax=Georgenia sp. SYP-B2076 TaxID=2495881 RepID=UPI00272B45D2|nr:MaoC family dehydratase [Georgenia sp. SYP-B2076]
MVRVFDDVAAFSAAAGEVLGTSDWVTVTQDLVDQFAEATGDRQWIHVDPERAASGPFGGTVAHGFLTLALVPVLMQTIYRIEDLALGVNYGADKVRFPQAVPVGSRVRASATLDRVTPSGPGIQAHIGVVVEIEGAAKPACVVEAIFILAGS